MRRFTHTFPQRISAFLLCLALLVGLLPSAAFAAGTDTGKAIQLVDSGIAANIGGGQADNLYFGTYQQSSDGNDGYNIDPIKWRVLENAGGHLFLLSDQNLDVFQYHTDWEEITWERSTMRSWLNGYGASENAGGDSGTDYTSDNFIGAAFSEKEQKAIAETTVVNDDNPDYNTDGGNDTTDRIFLLSIEEANNSSYFPNGNDSRKSTNTAYVASCSGMSGVGAADYWWLRSPGIRGNSAADVTDGGDVLNGGLGVGYTNRAVRPAFNLNLNSVLFTSAAVGGKSSGAVGADVLQPVSENAGNEWKLTLLDGNRSFTASTSSATTQVQGYSNWTVDVEYSSAQTGSNEYVSAMIVDGSGSVLYYGRVAQNRVSGTANITIPSGLTPGSYTLKVFSEQYNGDKKTDYASAFADIDLHVHGWSDTWNSDDTYHWHDCTAAGCPITDNSQKDGYGEHIFGNWATNNDGTHTQTCSTCGAEKTESCTYGEDGRCTVCGYAQPSYTISAGPETLNFGSATEGYTAPAAQTVTITNTGNQLVTVDLPTSADYTITAGTGFENGAASIAANGTAAFTVQPKTGLAPGRHSETLNISGSDGTSASVKLSFTFNAVYTLTVNLNGGSGSTTGGQYPAGEVVNIDAGRRSNYRFTGWTTSNHGSFADASSASTTFTMPAADTTITANWQYNPPYIPPTKPDGPSTGTSDGWEDIREEIADADKGDTISIDMGDETEVPGEIFEEVAGKDVTVEFELEDGISWTVNGQDIPTGTDFSDLDLGVDLGTSGIDVDVINTVTGELGSVQITLAHDGEFGFALTLTAPLGRENAGYWANLYHYDEAGETLDFETSAQVASDGTASLRMTHASQYAIVIDDKSHDLPFTDLGENQWYEAAVRYAFTHDIMEGMSATKFSPNISLTRAQAVQVLYNLEGQPTVSGNAAFPDLVEEWYKPAIAWAEQTGVVDGYEDGTFRPGQPVNRMEFAQMLYNYAAYKGCDLSAKGDLTAFPDEDSVQPWAETAMTWANGNALINGHDDGTLEPGGTTTRAQAASILMRFDQNVVEN